MDAAGDHRARWRPRLAGQTRNLSRRRAARVRALRWPRLRQLRGTGAVRRSDALRQAVGALVDVAGLERPACRPRRRPAERVRSSQFRAAPGEDPLRLSFLKLGDGVSTAAANSM